MKQFRIVFGVAAILALVACLAAPVMYFLGMTDESSFKSTFGGATITWFICAWLWARQPAQAAENSEY